MLTKETFDFLINNILILRFTLIILPLVLITLIIWDLGFFDAKRDTAQAVPSDKKASNLSAIAEETQAPAPAQNAAESVEEYDPFKMLLQQGDQDSADVGVVESEVLDKIEKKDEKNESIASIEPIDLGAYLGPSGSAAQESKSNVSEPAPEIGKQDDRAIGFEEIAAPPEEGGDDPWKVLIAKSVEGEEQSGSPPAPDAKKTIKIDLGELKEEEKQECD